MTILPHYRSCFTRVHTASNCHRLPSLIGIFYLLQTIQLSKDSVPASCFNCNCNTWIVLTRRLPLVMMMMMMMIIIIIIISETCYVLFNLFLTEIRLTQLGLLSDVDQWDDPTNYYFTSSIGYQPGSISDDHMSFYHKGMGSWENVHAALLKRMSLFRSLCYIRENSVTFEPLFFI